MSTNVVAGSAEESRGDRPKAGGGFFTVYKSGQGYWTRMCTAGGAALIGVLTAHFIYGQFPSSISRNVVLGVSVGFLAVFAIVIFWVMNKPTNADFLIATDSEMKKVNWTSRQELIGSTKVVIAFMILIAILLFGIDQFFQLLFWSIHVLNEPPFFIPASWLR